MLIDQENNAFHKKFWCELFNSTLLIPLLVFFGSTFLSPLHATDILFADYVFDPLNAKTEGWIALGISAVIWIVISFLYYFISTKFV